jgi:hypothetical protein
VSTTPGAPADEPIRNEIDKETQGMGKHILFQLNPWFEESGGPFYCPDCACVEGFFHYSPGVREKIDIRRIDFRRPRREVIDLLGEENQGCPVLVLDPGAGEPPGARRSLSTGRVFIDDPRAICDFLGSGFGSVRPHP